MCISGFMVYELLSKPLFHLIFTDEQIQYHCANVSGAETERPTAHRWCGRARAPEQAGVLVPNSYRRANQLWDRGHTSCLTDGSHHLLLRAFLPNFSGSRVWSNLSVQFSHSVMSDSLQPHGLQHARLPCPSPTAGACSNSCSSSRWCHPTISSSVVPFSSRLQSFPASGSFPLSQLFTSGGQSIEVSASASILLVNIQDWFPLGLTGWISLQSKGLSRVFSTPQFKSINSLALSFLYSPTLTAIHDYWKNHTFD